MKFYICRDEQDYSFDCVTTLREAKNLVAEQGRGSVEMVEVPVSKEAICALLGNFGGYAKECKLVWSN